MEKLDYLINYLLNENSEYNHIKIPNNIIEKKQLLRGLFNMRKPHFISNEFLNIQDEYLKEEILSKGIVEISNMQEMKDNIYIYQGDITTLAVDGIVNACNSALLGCFHPCHACIDNAIHTFAGVQLRNKCNEIMKGNHEPTGKAKITEAYNLPSKYILHTVGPIISSELTQNDCDLLKSCYEECLKLAVENELTAIAFCCISTGEFHFPNEKAAEIAVDTVCEFLTKNKGIKVIFNVFKEEDRQIYTRLLS